jgi:hypothetical protein
MTKLTQDAIDEIEAANKADKVEKFNVGPLTMRHVFEPDGITNVADLQAVLDEVEAALSAAAEIIAKLEANIDLKAQWINSHTQTTA